MTQDDPNMAQHGPRWAEKWPPKGAKMGPSWAQEGPKIGLQRPSNIEAEKGSVSLKDPGAFWAVWGPSWGSIGASLRDLWVILGLNLDILTQKSQMSKNEGPPIRNAHFWFRGEAPLGPRWGHDGLKLAS